MPLYAWVLLLSLAVPLGMSFEKRVAFYKLWPFLFAGIAANALLFIVWDGWFVRKGIWGFNPQYVWPARINNLPIEEWAFFFVIPYCSIYIYACLKVYLGKEPLAKHKHNLTLLFLIFTFMLALLNTQRAYTFYNCLFASLLLFAHAFVKRPWVGYFWLAYFIHLIPFLIVNGVLTGAVTPEPVVWYNEKAILGPRIYTIPVEDSIYALTCLLLPISIMEWLLQKRANKSAAAL